MFIFFVVNGLNESLVYQSKLTDEEKGKEIERIREEITYIENVKGNLISFSLDKSFYDQVKHIRDDNHELWETLEVQVDHTGCILDSDNIDHYILILSIKAGGVSAIARSKDHVDGNEDAKFYLSNKLG